MPGPEVLPYGVALREVLSRGQLTEMKHMLAVSNAMIGSLKDTDVSARKDWRESHAELQAAIDARDPLRIRKGDITIGSNGTVVIDNRAFAERAYASLNSDLEDDTIYLIVVKIEF